MSIFNLQKTSNWHKSLLSILILWLCSCHISHYPISVSSSILPISDSVSSPLVDSFIAPYNLSLNTLMRKPIATNATPLTKKPIESTLGNWVCDAMQWYCDSVEKIPIDIAICNYGGLRIGMIDTGVVSLNTMYELMPFDNKLCLVTLDSVYLIDFLNIIASKNGWPISKGLKMKITQEGKLSSWKIDKKVAQTQFIVAMSDYIADGGDNMDMLISQKHKILDITLRDIFIAYARHQQNLTTTLEQRTIIDQWK